MASKRSIILQFVDMDDGGGINGTAASSAQEFVYYSEAVIQPAIFLFGTLTNVLSLTVLTRVKLTHTFRICLISLAISDLCASITGFTNLVAEIGVYQGSMPFGFWHAEAVAIYAVYFLHLMFMGCSSALVILIAIVRNVIVLTPLKARSYFTKRRTQLLCACISGVTFVLFIPTSFNILWQSCFDDNVTAVCVESRHSYPGLKKGISVYLYFLISLYGPILFLAYIACVVCIWVTLKRSNKSLKVMTMRNKDTRKDNTVKRDKATAHITKTLLLILILDIVCTLPTILYSVGLIIRPKRNIYDDSNTLLEVLDAIAEIFLSFRPAYNFWLYFLQNDAFKKALREICMSKSQRHRRKASIDVLGYRRGTESNITDSSSLGVTVTNLSTSPSNKRRPSRVQIYHM